MEWSLGLKRLTLRPGKPRIQRTFHLSLVLHGCIKYLTHSDYRESKCAIPNQNGKTPGSNKQAIDSNEVLKSNVKEILTNEKHTMELIDQRKGG